MKFIEAERILGVLSNLKGNTGKFAYFVEKNLKTVSPKLREIYLKNVDRTPEETEFLKKRDALIEKARSLAETQEEKEFEQKKNDLIRVLQNPESSPESRDEANKSLMNLPVENKEIADVLEKRYTELQGEYKAYVEENAALLKQINGKLNSIAEMEVDVGFYTIPADDLPDNISQDIIRELVLVIRE